MTNQNCYLRWSNHVSNFVSVFSDLLNNECLVDVTLAAEGKYIQAHKVVLSACSSYFKELFSINPCQHPIVVLKDISFRDLRCVIDFIYYGEVNIAQERLSSILRVAETLNITGLAAASPLDPASTKPVSEKRPGEGSPKCRKKRLKKSYTTSSCLLSSSLEDLGVEIQNVEIKSETSPSVTEDVEIQNVEIKSETLPSVTEMPSIELRESSCLNGIQNIVDETNENMTTKDRFENNSSVSMTVLKNDENIGSISVITGGKKRSRVLIRQQNVMTKLDTDGEECSDADILASVKRPLERQYSDPTPQLSLTATSVSENRSNLLTVPTSHLIKQNSDSALPSRNESEELSVSRIDDLIAHALSQNSRSRSIHCPLLRPGPALGCNFCWNTVDTHGRILRRKTKYHCPECRTNLCIVPCFQDFHSKKDSSTQECETSKVSEKEACSDSGYPKSIMQKGTASSLTNS